MRCPGLHRYQIKFSTLSQNTRIATNSPQSGCKSASGASHMGIASGLESALGVSAFTGRARTLAWDKRLYRHKEINSEV